MSTQSSEASPRPTVPFWRLGETFPSMTKEATSRLMTPFGGGVRASAIWLCGGWLLGNVITSAVMICDLRHRHVTPTRGSSLASFLALQSPLAGYLGPNLCAALILAGFVAAVRFAQRRPLSSYLTAAPAFRWSRALIGFAWIFGVLTVACVAQYDLDPGVIQRGAALRNVLATLPIVLVLTPLQCLMEEVLFRGWLLQAVAGKKNRVALAFFTVTLTFGLPHLVNPEAISSEQLGWAALYYVGLGGALTGLALLENGLELSIGLHVGMNLFAAVLLSAPGGSLRLPTLFTQSQLDLRETCLWSAVIFAGAFALRALFRGAPRRDEGRALGGAALHVPAER